MAEQDSTLCVCRMSGVCPSVYVSDGAIHEDRFSFLETSGPTKIHHTQALQVSTFVVLLVI